MESNKEVTFVSAVVYCCNDSATIGDFIKNIDKTLSDNFLKYEIIIVNDASTDNSTDIIKDVATHNDNKVITLLNMSHRQGLESSMNAGVDLAIGDFVFEFDNAFEDFSWSLMMDLYRHSLKGYDIVSARPNKRMKFSSRLFYLLFNHYANLQYEIATESFRILSRRAINRVHGLTESVPYRKASYANCGLAIDSLLYTPIAKERKVKKSDRKTLAVDSLILYTDIAYQVTIILAAFMVFATLSLIHI